MITIIFIILFSVVICFYSRYIEIKNINEEIRKLEEQLTKLKRKEGVIENETNN